MPPSSPDCCAATPRRWPICTTAAPSACSGFCTGLLRDHHEAADALHDTVLVAAERIGQLRDPERLRPWLYAIARTRCLARLRRRARTAVSEDPTELAGGRTMTADGASDDDVSRTAEGGEAGELV